MSEGIFYKRVADEFVETDNWPKGRSRARLQADKQPPFGNYSVFEARAKVAEFIAAEKRAPHGYVLFSILPIAGDPMPEHVKEALKEAGARKRKVAKESEDVPIVDMHKDAEQMEVRPVPGNTAPKETQADFNRKTNIRIQVGAFELEKAIAIGAFDLEKAIAMYKEGKSVMDIAEAVVGPPRGRGRNKTVAALKKAGVYKD